MGVFGGPEIPNDGLVLALDAANPRNFNLTAVEVLVVAGGGAGGGYGGNDGAGGGGAGGLIYNSNFAVTPGTQLTVTVGAGGAGVGGAIRGTNGNNSVFSSLTAIGGGGGGTEGVDRVGKDGGSGGGAGGFAVKPGGLGTAGQGFAGGDCTGPGDGGGGGAGAAGQSGLTGIGGIGLAYSISGTSTYYAGGGGASGDKRNTRGGGGALGGLGGGGKGQDATNSTPPENGTNATGGGGGAAAGSTPTYGAGTTLTSGSGGSGIVIVRYQGPQKAIGGTVTSVGGDTIHTFTTSGNFTPLVNTNGSAVLGLSDLSGNRNFGDSGGSGVLYSSANGGSLSFDGYNDYVNAPLTKSATCTFSCWARTTTLGSSPMLFNAGPNGVGPDLFFYSGNIYWNIWDGGANPLATTPASVTDGNYHYYVVVNDASSNTKLYYDGVLLGTATYRSAANNTNLTIGGTTDTYMWNGNISNFSIYNRALTAAEISQNFNALRGRFGL